jgi:hypothetical protein
MPMNSTPQNPGHKFPFSSEHNAMDNKTLIVTLGVSMAVAFSFTLLLYASMSSNPVSSRVGYGVLVSLLPALGVLGVLKLTRLLLSWRGAVFIYVLLFVVVLIIQMFGRMIPVNS